MTAELSPIDSQPGEAQENAGQGVGVLLREARQRAGISLEEASHTLKMQTRVLEALEAERWEQLGAPVFVRGQLRSYAKLLKVDAEPFLQQLQMHAPRPVQLISHTHVPRYRHLLESAGRRSLYVVITLCFFAIPVWLATKPHLGTQPQATAALDVFTDPQAAPSVELPRVASAEPITASLAPLPRVNLPALSLRMKGDSWLQVTAADGSSLEQGLVKAGEQRTYANGQVAGVVIGNAAEVEVQQAGRTVDVTPFQRANVARFTVSSDGSLVPAAD